MEAKALLTVKWKPLQWCHGQLSSLILSNGVWQFGHSEWCRNSVFFTDTPAADLVVLRVYGKHTDREISESEMTDKYYVLFWGPMCWLKCEMVACSCRDVISDQMEPEDIQIKQLCFRNRPHFSAVNRGEPLPLIFIRLLNPYLQTSPSAWKYFIKEPTELDQPVVIWQTTSEFAHESSPWGGISSVVLILLDPCLSEPTVTARNLCGNASSALAFMTREWRWGQLPTPQWRDTCEFKRNLRCESDHWTGLYSCHPMSAHSSVPDFTELWVSCFVVNS